MSVPCDAISAQLHAVSPPALSSVPVTMSLKVLHTRKDGTQVPVKVTIWDAFRGPPKREPCACCGKTHKAKITSTGSGRVKDYKHKSSTKEDDDGLTEDDRIMLRMKRENESAQWKDIFEATKNFKNIEEAKERFREIKDHLNDDDKDTTKQGGKKNKKKNQKNDVDEDKAEEIRRKTEEGQRKKAERLAGQVTEANKVEEAATKGDGASILQQASREYDRNKGRALAAKHFDKTGIRISAREALKMAEGK